MKYSTPLKGYYEAVTSLLESAQLALPNASSVTFKSVHYFHEPEKQLVFFGECANETIVRAYRRTAACAVSAYNRKRATGKKAWLFDAFEATRRFPRDSKSPDGHHLVDQYLHRVADAYFHGAVCPGLPLNRSAGADATAGVLMTQDPDVIDATFECAAIHSIAARWTATKRSKRDSNKRDALETLMGLGPRPGCRCQATDPRQQLSDECALGRQLSAVLTGDRKYSGDNPLASAVYEHLCDAGEAVTPPSHDAVPPLVAPTHFASELLSADPSSWRDEVIAELCLQPTGPRALQCMRNVGYQPAFPSWNHPFVANMTTALSASGDVDQHYFAPYCRCDAPTQDVHSAAGENGPARAPMRCHVGRRQAIARIKADWHRVLGHLLFDGSATPTSAPLPKPTNGGAMLACNHSSVRAREAQQLTVQLTCSSAWQAARGPEARAEALRSILAAAYDKPKGSFLQRARAFYHELTALEGVLTRTAVSNRLPFVYVRK
jgi:hypothetical protein